VGSWAVTNSLYVSTDNAQIDGVQLLVNAPTSGTLVNWSVDMGSTLTAGQEVGRIAVQAGYMQPEVTVRAPASGIVAVNNGVNGAFVTAGTQLAIAYDPSAVFVTARIDETKINDVHVGQVVDIAVDAYSGTPLVGRVVEIKTGAAGVFSLFGQSNTTGNFQKVTQVIPVKIAIDDRSGLALVPGMNVTAKIHRS
jgi:multidrug resistance efflux pump